MTTPEPTPESALLTEAAPLVVHRPYGIEHPYATSIDQRIPVLPEVGETVYLGVQAGPEVTEVSCEWVTRFETGAASGADRGSIAHLPLTPATVDAAEAAALAGGEGHLAEAQAASLGGAGGWAVRSPALEHGFSYAYRFHAVDAAGRRGSTPWFEVAPARWTTELPDSLTARLSGAGHRLVRDSVQWLVGGGRVHRARLALSLAPGEHVVGFGERFDRLDQRGHRLDAVVFEQYKAQGAQGRTYLPMPFAHVVGGRGTEGGAGTSWGFHVRTSRRTWFDVGAEHPDRLVIEVDLGSADSTSVHVDLGLYEGTPTGVLTAFLDEVGRAEVLPEWVFRLWASGNEWNTQAIVLERMDAHRDLSIPVGAVVIEAWSDEEGITIFRDAQYAVREDGSAHGAGDFTYPEGGAWPDPAAMIQELHRRGIKVILWQIPLQKTDPELTGQVLADAQALVREGHAVLEADGSAYHNRGWWFPRALMPDLSVERTRAWWAAKRRYLVADLDVDGFKTDGGEHAWGHDLQYGDGRRGDEGNNLYPVHYARTFGDLLRAHGKAPVTFSRSGFTGSQAHGIFWAGDEDSTWQAYRNSIIAGVTAASCGIVYWGWDLAGFSGPVPEAELYLRAAGAATFMPIMQYHSEFNHHQRPLRDRTPWFVAETTGDDSVVPTFRAFAELRERLVPYLVEAAAEAVAGDRPLMRPLFFDHSQDGAIWDHPEQFMLGSHLLVNPVTQAGAQEWATYLPAGRWIEVFSGAEHEGARVVTLPAPIAQVPVFCRAEAWPGLVGVFHPSVP